MCFQPDKLKPICISKNLYFFGGEKKEWSLIYLIKKRSNLTNPGLLWSSGQIKDRSLAAM